MRRTFHEFKSEIITRSEVIKRKRRKVIHTVCIVVPASLCAVLAITFFGADRFAQKSEMSDMAIQSGKTESYSYMQNDTGEEILDVDDEIIDEIDTETIDEDRGTETEEKKDKTANSADGVPLKTTIQICKTEGETVSYKNVTSMSEVYNIMKILNGETDIEADKQNLDDVEIKISVTYLDNTENIYIYVNSDGITDPNGTFLLTAEQASAILKIFEENK